MSNLLKDKDGNTSSKRVAAFVTIATAILVSVFLDKALGWVGYPNEHQEQITHPANFSETRHNIEFTYNFSTNSTATYSCT